MCYVLERQLLTAAGCRSSALISPGASIAFRSTSQPLASTVAAGATACCGFPGARLGLWLLLLVSAVLCRAGRPDWAISAKPWYARALAGSSELLLECSPELATPHVCCRRLADLT